MSSYVRHILWSTCISKISQNAQGWTEFTQRNKKIDLLIYTFPQKSKLNTKFTGLDKSGSLSAWLEVPAFARFFSILVRGLPDFVGLVSLRIFTKKWLSRNTLECVTCLAICRNSWVYLWYYYFQIQIRLTSLRHDCERCSEDKQI